MRQGWKAGRPVERLMGGAAGLSLGGVCEFGEEQKRADQTGAVVNAVMRIKVTKLAVRGTWALSTPIEEVILLQRDYIPNFWFIRPIEGDTYHVSDLSQSSCLSPSDK